MLDCGDGRDDARKPFFFNFVLTKGLSPKPSQNHLQVLETSFTVHCSVAHSSLVEVYNLAAYVL